MNILEKARPENSFRCADGSVISSVYELENRLCTMGSEAFHHHANPTRNDFHNWIRDVFQDYELANELLSAKTPAQAAATVRKHLRKALLAKEEIEDAIKTVSTAKTKIIRAAGIIQRKKPTPKSCKHKSSKARLCAVASPASAGLRNRPLPMLNRAQPDLRLGKAAATAKKAKKNRKLIKKRNTQQHGRKINSRGRTKSKHHGSSHKKRGRSARKRAKKQVNRWLNWLKIVPEL